METEYDDTMDFEHALRKAVALREAIAARTDENREDGAELKELKQAIDQVMADDSMDKVDDVPSAARDEDGEPVAYYTVTRAEKTEYPTKAAIMQDAIKQFLAEGNVFEWDAAMDYVAEYRKRKGEKVHKVVIRKKKPKKVDESKGGTVAFDEIAVDEDEQENGGGIMAAKHHGPPVV